MTGVRPLTEATQDAGDSILPAKTTADALEEARVFLSKTNAGPSLAIEILISTKVNVL